MEAFLWSLLQKTEMYSWKHINRMWNVRELPSLTGHSEHLYKMFYFPGLSVTKLFSEIIVLSETKGMLERNMLVELFGKIH